MQQHPHPAPFAQSNVYVANNTSRVACKRQLHLQVAHLNVPYILMHMRGTPETMQQHTKYSDTRLEVGQELQQQASKAVAAGIEPWRIVLDPGRHAMPVSYMLIRIRLKCMTSCKPIRRLCPLAKASRTSFYSNVRVLSAASVDKQKQSAQACKMQQVSNG